jgi:hypothetical protein
MDAAALYRRTKAGGTFCAAAERPPLMKQMRNLPTTASTAAQQFRLDVPRTWLPVRPPAAAVRLRRAKRRRTRQVCAAPWAAVGMWPFLCVCVCVRVCACVTSRSSHYQQLANPGVRPEYPRSARRVLVEYPRIVPSTIVVPLLQLCACLRGSSVQRRRRARAGGRRRATANGRRRSRRS